jgi:hypothetical protein
MKLTVISLVGLFLIFSFAGVQPLSDYKDSLFDSVLTYLRTVNQLADPSIEVDTLPPIIDSPPITSDGICARTGRYGDYFLGLVEVQGDYIVGAGSYSDAGSGLIVLINDENATDPSFSALLNFLWEDRTDEFPYVFHLWVKVPLFGRPEASVNLTHVRGIINGIAQPGDPEMRGLR